jgi:hypothetical protein
MVSASTLHDDPALDVAELPEKVIAESNPNTSTIVNDDADRIDVEDPRNLEDPRAEDAAGEDVAEDDEMARDDAHKILDRYGFGAGMRMYARSLALAELQEKEEAAKAKAAAELVAEKEALLRAKEENLAKEENSSKVRPSVASVIDFETVRSELSKVVQSIASLGSMDYLSQNKVAKQEIGAVLNNEDEDEDDVMEEASRDEIRTNGQGCCGAEDALKEIFREAEVWAEATYKQMSVDQTCSSASSKRSLKRSGWSFFKFPRKDKNQITENLRLDEGYETDNSGSKKHWWDSIFCAPVVLDEKN